MQSIYPNRSHNILIVDDTPDNLRLLSATLTQHGYDVRGVINGAMALRVAQTAPPDLILLDIKLPDFDGYEVCEALKASEATCSIPVIFLSALDEAIDKVKAFAVGGVDYITKPFQIGEVVARIKNQLALQAAQMEICKLNAELEQRVMERTAELAATNQRLMQEIAERKQAETALRASEERFRLVLDNSPTTIFSQDVDLRYTWVYNSPNFGLDAETMIGKRSIDLFKAEDAERLDAISRQVIAQKKGIRYDVSMQINDCLCYYDLTVDPLLNASGLVIGVTCAATDITQIKQAETKLRQQAKQERLIAAIAQRIRQSLNLNEILTTTVAEVRQFLQSDRVLIYQFDSDWSGIVTVESVAQPQLSLLSKVVRDECFSQTYFQQYQQGRVRGIEDIDLADLTPCHVEFLKSMQVRANLVVPIICDQQLWGLLIAHCTQPRTWTTQEIDLLVQLSTQVAIAIQQSNLYEQVQQLNANLEQQVQERTAQLQQARAFDALLKRITDKVRDSLDENQILQVAVEELAQGLNVTACDTAMYDLEQQTSTICYEYSNTAVTAKGKVWQMANFAEVYDQLLQHQCFQFCKQHSVRGWSTLLACPIFDDQGFLGDMWLCRPKEALFTEEEFRLVQQVANQCAIALRQARLYAAAQAQVETLESLHVLKDDFLSTVSHELRSPVTNMKMAIQMLDVALRQMGIIDDLDSNYPITVCQPLPESQRIAQYLHILENECDREIELINDLLDLQRLEANEQPLPLETVDLNLWLPSLIESFHERTQARQQQLQLDLPPVLPMIVSNLDALSRILAELLNNACKYTPPDQRIVFALQLEEDCLRLDLTNFGNEIPEGELPYIFEKFYRVAGGDRWNQGGTGLGLALVKKLVECLQGTVTASSIHGKTTFTVRLPYVLSPVLSLVTS